MTAHELAVELGLTPLELQLGRGLRQRIEAKAAKLRLPVSAIAVLAIERGLVGLGGVTNHVDITGCAYGRLRVLRRSETRFKAGATWDCLCACGAIVPKLGTKLRTGREFACSGYICPLGGKKAKERPPRLPEEFREAAKKAWAARKLQAATEALA